MWESQRFSINSSVRDCQLLTILPVLPVTEYTVRWNGAEKLPLLLTQAVLNRNWVYIPFTSYVSNVGPEGKPVAGLYGHDSINKYMILTGPYSIKDKNDQPTNYTIIFDELQLVKLDVTQEGLADALKEFQTDNDGDDSEKESESFNDDDPFGEDSEFKKVSTDKPQSVPSVVTTENAGESGSSNTTAIIIIAVAAAAVIAVAVVLIIRKKKK